MPDSIAYFKFYGLDPAEPIVKSNMVKYKRIFIFERLVYEDDHVRVENNSHAGHLHDLICEAYQMMGYNMIHIPVCPVEQRVDMILSHL